jgi:hypothetical protein
MDSLVDVEDRVVNELSNGIIKNYLELPTPVLKLKQNATVFLLVNTSNTIDGASTGKGNDRDVIMMREGFNQHPFIRLIGEGPGDNPDEVEAAAQADFVLYPMWGDGRYEQCQRSCVQLIRRKLVPREKLVVLDFSDGHRRLPWNPASLALVTFKRSLISKNDGTYTSTSDGCDYHSVQPCFPLDYAVRPYDYKGLTAASLLDARNISIVFLHAVYHNMPEKFISKVSSARLRVKHWLRTMNLPENVVIGTSRSSHEAFRHADIVIVADPAAYEGQHAIYEALGNGAVVMANYRWVPMPHPFVEGKHVHYFDVCDTKTSRRAFQEKVTKLLAETPQEKARFRLRSWTYALHHQAVNRMDYVVSTALEGMEQGSDPKVPTSLQVNVNETERHNMMTRCIAPVMQLRGNGKWIEENPFLKGLEA